jgi:hypothetical protein
MYVYCMLEESPARIVVGTAESFGASATPSRATQQLREVCWPHASRSAVTFPAACRMWHRVTCLRHECVTSGLRFVIMPLRRWDHRKWWHSLLTPPREGIFFLRGTISWTHPSLTFRRLPNKSVCQKLHCFYGSRWFANVFTKSRILSSAGWIQSNRM